MKALLYAALLCACLETSAILGTLSRSIYEQILVPKLEF